MQRKSLFDLTSIGKRRILSYDVGSKPKGASVNPLFLGTREVDFVEGCANPQGGRWWYKPKGRCRLRHEPASVHSGHVELTCRLPIGLERALCSLEPRGAALEPSCHEKINPRGKSQLKRRQHMPGVQAQIEWFLDIIAGVHLAPPAGSAEGAALRRELHSCFADQLGFELKIRTLRHHGHARPIGQPNKRPDAGGKPCDVCGCDVHCGPQECGQFTRDECRYLSAEKAWRVKLFVHAVQCLLRAGNFRTPARSSGFENFSLR